MNAQKREITATDILPLETYAAERGERKRALLELKKNRRVEVGSVCTFYFENYATMWAQVQEMLYIEKGGAEQLEDELAAYNPMIPDGRELTATVMFEIDDPVRRADFLGKLGGIEETAFLQFDGQTIDGNPEADIDRTNAAGKASAVQFIHFPFSAGQIAKFRAEGIQVVLGFRHPQYGHMTVLPEAVRASLSEDFD